MAATGVRKFYKDSTILITGSTGFLGQVLLEKILHTLDPRKIYLLIRRKNNLAPEQRLQSLLDGVLFERVRSSTTSKQLVPIEVDLSREDLGIDSETHCDLRRSVDIVFSLAASVIYVNPLEKAVQENTRNVINLFNLLKDMPNLRSGIHVSTMWSNLDRLYIEEKVYTDVGFGGVNTLVGLLEKLDDSERQAIAPIVLKGQGTYTFAKKCAEVKLQQDFANLPIGIFRAPGISSIHREPIAGWTNNLYGIGGFMSPLALGIYGTYLVDPNKQMMLAPVDYCANALLLSAVDTNRNFKPSNSTIPVYNYAANDVPNIRDMINSYIDGAMGPIKGLFYRNFMNTLAADLNRYLFGVRLMRAHASLVDRMRSSRGQKPSFRRSIDNAVRATLNSSNLGLNTWRMENANVRRMQQGLDEEEAELFRCDLEGLDWHEHFRRFIPGIRKYVFAQKIEGFHQSPFARSSELNRK